MITGASPALVPSPKGFIAWRDRDPVRYWESVLALGVISAVLAWTAFR
jgi:hypothetical protein